MADTDDERTGPLTPLEEAIAAVLIFSPLLADAQAGPTRALVRQLVRAVQPLMSVSDVADSGPSLADEGVRIGPAIDEPESTASG